MKNPLNDLVFLIPSLDPDDKLPTYVKELIKAGVKHVLIVDDGSKQENQHFFEEIANKKEVVILRHVVNQGKGRALKTGFNYVLDQMPKIKGVITADSDGQHAVDDTIRCGTRLLETNDVVFGTRDFNEKNVPFKSRNGNKITTFIFKLMYGVTVHDTQTGLRALPIDFVRECLELTGERYDYEIGMLIKIVGDERNIIEEPIKTIYYNGNSGTHFKAFRDSFRIYKVMLSSFLLFALSSMFSFVVELVVYSFSIRNIFDSLDFAFGIFCATVVGRVISSIINYTVNKNTVFASSNKNSMRRYYILAAGQMLASWLLITIAFDIIGLDTTFLKVFVDFGLFLIGYRIQKKWVFKEQ